MFRRKLADVEGAYKAIWPTREPRGQVWDDGRPSVAAMLRALPSSAITYVPPRPYQFFAFHLTRLRDAAYATVACREKRPRD